uniref:Mitochondrial splicing suppressor 51-like C-terminal domain-containing protein n=1 Tax=Cacopsylla melanoneura TaxID=428564 RepID=A0A8D9AT80_9HEMI
MGAFNAGFHEFENQSHSNTWTKTLNYFLKTKRLPIAFTGYTKDEICRDSEIIKSIASSKDNLQIEFITEKEINAEASEKPRMDPEDGVYYLNKYISCFYCK